MQNNGVLDALPLWGLSVGGKNSNSIVVGLFVQSLNEVIDLHANECKQA